MAAINGSPRAGRVWPAPRPRYICVTSVHGVMTARDDREVREILNGADIVTPDGMPLVWALRSLGLSQPTCLRTAIDATAL